MTKDDVIPFNRPCFVGNEQEYIAQSIHNSHISGDGIFTEKCQNFLESALGVNKAFLTTSCTDALEMAALLLDLSSDDEVIFPSFTFVSTVNAFVLRGIKPVFVDIRPDTLNIDENLIERAITPRTKAIVVVHYAGASCEMDKIRAIAAHNNIPVIEDNAHGLFGKYKGEYLGTFGSMATQSFHETKNFTCGEGGALLLNEPALVERADIIRQKGTNRSSYFRGQVDKYTWVDVGSSYLPSDLLAAFLFAQFEARVSIQQKRKQIWEYYNTHLREWAALHQVGLPFIPAHCEQPYHIFYLIMPTLDLRQALITHLKSLGIGSAFHYTPLHLSPMGQRFGGKPGDCPITEDISNRLLRLPFFYLLTDVEQSTVVKAVQNFDEDFRIGNKQLSLLKAARR